MNAPNPAWSIQCENGLYSIGEIYLRNQRDSWKCVYLNGRNPRAPIRGDIQICLVYQNFTHFERVFCRVSETWYLWIQSEWYSYSSIWESNMNIYLCTRIINTLLGYSHMPFLVDNAHITYPLEISPYMALCLDNTGISLMSHFIIIWMHP